MDAMTGVTGVLGRIDDITTRFGAGASEPFVVVESEAFDPFGAQYQAAVSTFQSGVGPATFAQSYSAPVPGMSGVGAVGMSGTPSLRAAAPPPAQPTGEQIQRAIDGIAGPPGHRPIGGYGKLPVPAEIVGYGNGRVPREALTPIGQGNHRLFAPAAAAWQNVVAAAGADGIELRITDSYRPYEEQVDLANRKGLYKNGGLAAVPGTSTHGWGMAVDADIRDPATMEWLRVNGPRFGWVESTPREPWHWEFRPAQV
jgi:zinc D-Ala-D-Ala carboxypeptidase